MMFKRKRNNRFSNFNNRAINSNCNINQDVNNREFSREIREGDSGASVYRVQNMLTGACEMHNNVIPAIIVDGEYGDETRNAVMKFQEFMGINVTGIVDKLTYSELEKEYDTYIKHSRQEEQEYNLNMNTKKGFHNTKYDSKIVGIGSSGDNVVELQVSLNKLADKYSLIPKLTVDGKFGEKTENSVKIFQGMFNLPTDGIVGKYTWTAIFDALQGKVFPQTPGHED